MDNKILRFYNQNRYLVWIIILTIVAIISLIYILNNFFAKRDSKSIIQNTETTSSKTQDKNYSVITGKKVESQIPNIINSFIEYCNNGNVEEAYKLLSDECKEVLYPNVESFRKNYYSKVFNTKKLFAYQALISDYSYYTYQINFTEDILATRKNS